MELTIHLPDDLGCRILRLQDPESFVVQAITQALVSLDRTETHPAKPSRWARLVERIETDPIHLDGYSEQLKRDSRAFRNDSEFRHDCES